MKENDKAIIINKLHAHYGRIGKVCDFGIDEDGDWLFLDFGGKEDEVMLESTDIKIIE
jgi:hypothetical protein